MSDQNQLDDNVDEGTETEKGLGEERNTGFQNAADFVDDEIDAVDSISELSVEALVVLAVLRIVDNPDALRVNVTRASRLIVIELDVKEEDLGQVIGTHGHTIDSIRSIARSAAGKSEIEYDITPLEKGCRPPRRDTRRGRSAYSSGRRNFHSQGRGYRKRSNGS